MTKEKVQECFASAEKDEEQGKKHKGLLFTRPDREEAKSFIIKAKKNMELCGWYKEQGFDYKIPEEWFYILYYCALAILALFGVESRSQRCTALFLRYVKDKSLIEYDDEFIERIQVYKQKEKLSDVDEREKGRYSSLIQMKEVLRGYDEMTALCKRAISQCEEITFSDRKYVVPEEVMRPKH
ncbi:MAG: hypothetical protein AABX13_03710 [Nanoarchaeota archaeon]